MSQYIHYCGHIISNNSSGRFPQLNETDVQQAINICLTDINVDSCYGSLASGADIMLAEALLNKGAKLNLVLPFDQSDFIELSVISSGDEWQNRFNKLMKQAHSMTQVFYTKPVGEQETLSFAVCTIVAMGLCLADVNPKQDEATSDLSQLTVWDGEKTTGIAGTYPDMLRWQSLGFDSTYISSKQPITINTFTENFNPSLAILNINVYDEFNFDNCIKINNLDELLATVKSEPFNGHYMIDLDHHIFGKASSNFITKITKRALGLIVFYGFSQKNFADKQQLLAIILKM